MLYDLMVQVFSSMDATLRLATPLIFASMAGLLSERAGIVDIGLEGKILISAFAAAAVSALILDPQIMLGITRWWFGDDIFIQALNGNRSLKFMAKRHLEDYVMLKQMAAGIDKATAKEVFANTVGPFIQSYKYWMPLFGLAAGLLASLFFAVIHGYTCISKHGDQIVSGVALNFIALGLTYTLAQSLFNMGGATPSVPRSILSTPITLPFADGYSSINELGFWNGLYSGIISGHKPLVYLALLMVPTVAFILYRTHFGLKLRAVGENPNAVDTAGISVQALRYKAVLLCGLLCGFAGSYLSIAHNSAFSDGMSAQKGYIALAAVIFGRWRPGMTLVACLLFAFMDAIQTRLQGAMLFGYKIPLEFVQMLPYVLTILILAGFVKKAIAPKAIGKPYIKEFSRG